MTPFEVRRRDYRRQIERVNRDGWMLQEAAELANLGPETRNAMTGRTWLVLLLAMAVAAFAALGVPALVEAGPITTPSYEGGWRR